MKISHFLKKLATKTERHEEYSRRVVRQAHHLGTEATERVFSRLGVPPSLFYFARGYVETSYGGQDSAKFARKAGFVANVCLRSPGHW